MAEEVKYIHTLMLSDGSVYQIRDVNAAHMSDLAQYLSLDGGVITGNLEVDAKLKSNELYIMSVQTTLEPVTNVLTVDGDGQVKKREASLLLADIGGVSGSIDDSSGILSLIF